MNDPEDNWDLPTGPTKGCGWLLVLSAAGWAAIIGGIIILWRLAGE